MHPPFDIFDLDTIRKYFSDRFPLPLNAHLSISLCVCLSACVLACISVFLFVYLAVLHMCLFVYGYLLVFVNVLALWLKNKKMVGLEHLLEKSELASSVSVSLERKGCWLAFS